MAVYIFAMSLIKIYAFGIWWLQPLLNLFLFSIILGFFIRIILSDTESLWFLIYWILTLFRGYVVRCICFVCISDFLIFILLYLCMRYFVNRQHACIYSICWWTAYWWCLFSIIFKHFLELRDHALVAVLWAHWWLLACLGSL